MYRKTCWDYIKDAHILEVGKFPQWHKSSHDWPESSWKNYNNQAYHIRYLIHEVLRLRRWIGPPPRRGKYGWDGHHRVRAVKFIWDNYRIRIRIPKFIND